jgi:Holliday junction DNA helicase RuvA
VIGFLKGTLASKQPPRLMLDVGGVGYELEAPMSTFYELPDIGSRLTLVTHLVVREDAHMLYGFSSEVERSLFRNLLKVSGIGARIALAVLSSMSVAGFSVCVRDKDVVSLTRIPGVGKKTAERLLIEMADRLPEADVSAAAARRNGAGAQSEEAEGALLALGYRQGEISRMLKNLDTENMTTEQLIREALRQVHRRGAAL